jgi:nicotinate-nucleotide adenylyltransferase
LGGTLDPIHVGHIQAAKAATAALDLDEVLIVPAGQPWQKDGRVFAIAPDRLTMASLASADENKMVVSDVDVRRPGPTYTADTMVDVRREEPPAKWWFIVGADAFANLPTWHHVERLGGLARFAVVPREGTPEKDVAAAQRAMQESGAEVGVDLIEMPRVQVSSSQIRQMVVRGESIEGLVHPLVGEYIAAHGLYAESAAKVAS